MSKFSMRGLIKRSLLCGLLTAVLSLTSCAFFKKNTEVNSPINQEQPFIPQEGIHILSSVLQQNDILELVDKSRTETDADRVCVEAFNAADFKLQHFPIDDDSHYEANVNYLKHQRARCYAADNSVAGMKRYLAKILFTSRYVSVAHFSSVCQSLVKKGVTDQSSCMSCLADTRERSLSCLFGHIH